MVLLDLSIILNFSTVLIADLHHAKGPLSLDDRAASWIGSLAYIFQPTGSLMSGILVEKLGRKGGILVVNIPYLLAWILFCTAPNVTMLFVANILTGIAVGLSEAPLNNYGGEMTQPHIRGTVISIGCKCL
ncbi:hypothetical protein C0J52_20805 [Blattella germanica]|nr:hypothetical protein C0J52_20805 [Blattella germanica]